jgi:hypothetical protein
MWRMDYSLRVTMGIALLALVSLHTTLQDLTISLSSLRSLPPVDNISRYEQRFAEARHYLPPDQIILYLDDFDEQAEQCDAFALAQYSVAPTVLAAFDSKCRNSQALSALSSRLLLANFHDEQKEPYLLSLFPSKYFGGRVGKDPYRFVRADRLVLVRDFGRGVRLYMLQDK